MISRPIIAIQQRPDTEADLCEIAEGLLQKAGAVDRLPTPIDHLIVVAGVEDVQNSEMFKEQFLSSLPQKFHEVFESAWDKIRGIADLRDKAVYVPRTTTAPRVLFAKCHELGHQVIPWQIVNTTYQDDDRSLCGEVEELFDLEANLFAAELIFQGKRFTKRVRDYQPSFDAVSLLAQEHGASRHATLRRYVEEHDETLAAIPYWPSRYITDEDGYPVLRAGKLFCSPRFIQRYSCIQLPIELRTGHEWVTARDTSDVHEGNIQLDCGAGPVNFQWQSWWNTYCLLFLLRRKPILSLVGRLVHG